MIKSNPPEKIALKDQLRALSVNENLRMENKLYCFLAHLNKVPYGLVINLLDQLNIAETDITQRLSAKNEAQRKFALTPLTDGT